MQGFHRHLGHLVAAYHDGVLVPFIGSGMSMGACVTWKGMLANLACRTIGDAGIEDGDDPSTLYRIADRLVTLIEPRPVSERADIYREAVTVNCPRRPAQSKALAATHWPLVISTNYDDVYWSAASRDGAVERALEVLGRSPADCHHVLASLDATVDPILWAIQGFVGGPFHSPGCSVPDADQRLRLAEQVVVGHQQYQRAMSDALHFRRAFAEVYRRRSLWFLGSGITEPYLINLLSEVRHYAGVSRHPHFAWLQKDSLDKMTLQFLERRLGIVALFYENHRCLPGILDTFSTRVRKPLSRLNALRHELHTGCSDGRNTVDVEIVDTPLPVPCNGATIVSVGRRGDGEPLLGCMARGATKARGRRNWGRLRYLPRQRKEDACLPSVFRYGCSDLFAVAARVAIGGDTDVRDLGSIAVALKQGLEAAGEDHGEIHVGSIASGPARPWHPIHPFVQMLVAVRQFVTGCSRPNVSRIVLHVVDWRVWLALRGNMVPVSGILLSAMVQYRVEVLSTSGSFESLTVTKPHTATVRGILDAAGLAEGCWDVDLVPEPGFAVGPDTVVPASAVVRVRHKPTGDRGRRAD